MADKTSEQLSALIDGECETPEVGLAILRLCKDKDLQACWERYHLISDALKNNIPEVINTGFCNRLSQAIAAGSPLPAKASFPAYSWRKPAAGVALAASVAAVALIGLKALSPGDDGSLTLTAAVPAPERVSGAGIEPGDPRPFNPRLNNYLVNHNEYASMASVNGMMPYVRMVGYQTDR